MVQEHHSLTWLAAALAAAVLLSGCPAPETRPSLPNTPSPAPQSPVPPQILPPNLASPTPSPPRPPQPPRENHLSPATRSLVTQARTLMSHGDFDGASSTLDRALRIEPNNPLLWIERGRLRLADSDAHQAEGCGRKALALASGDPATQKLAGRLLADALRVQQRNQEAHEIESRPFMH
jgi:tetratricopeptide (TPR) repeat protein